MKGEHSSIDMAQTPGNGAHLTKLSATDEGGVEAEGESEAARIERLGRQRPERLSSAWKEADFVFSIVMSQLLTEYFVSGFTRLPSFLLPFGRLADMYGGFPVYVAGCAWYCTWFLIAGFSQNELMLDICRALQGLGPAAYLPASLTLLGSMYRPGPRMNLVLSIYGAMAPLGFFIGIFFAGVSGQYAGWRWYFWIGTILTAITAVIAYYTIPNDIADHRGNGVKMDWWGSITTASGLILLVFAITDSSHAPRGWATPYIYATLILGILLLAAAFYVEGWVAEQPLLPFEVFRIKYMKPFVLGLLFTYGTLGIFILYATLYLENIMHKPPMLVVAWYGPMAAGGCTLATLGGFVLHRIPDTVMMAITGIAIIIDSMLFALAPVGANYWAWYFPAMICATVAIDLIFNVANIFLSTAFPARQLGLTGALANVLLHFIIALLLGFANIVVTATADQGERQSYKNAFCPRYLMGFVRMESAKSDLTADEKEAQKALEWDTPP